MFLSPDWMELLGASLPPADPSASIRIGQVVTGAPGGDVRYQVVIEHGKATIESDHVEAADLTLHLPYAVAVAIATGAQTPQDALQSGALSVGGDLRRLADAAAAMAALGPAMASVRSQTTYP